MIPNRSNYTAPHCHSNAGYWTTQLFRVFQPGNEATMTKYAGACSSPISPNLAKQRCGKTEIFKLQDLFLEVEKNLLKIKCIIHIVLHPTVSAV